MSLLKKYKVEILLGLGLTLFYFVFRSVSLLNLPIFTDEAIYMWWAQTGLHDANWRFISLVDGKQPLFVWFTMAFMKFINDPLLAGRLVSVFSGFFTMVGLYLLSYELFKDKRVSFLTALIYIVYPFAQVYDRMALMDGMVGTFAVWGMYFSVLLVRRIQLSVAYTLGLIIAGGVLTKSNGIFTAYMLPFTLLLFDFKNKKRLNRFLKWILLAILACAISQVLYNALRLSPFFYIIKQKNAAFVYPISEWILHPFTYFGNNAQTLIGWFISYFNIYIVLAIFPFLDLKNFLKEKILLLLYFLLPFLVFALFAKATFPRYIYFMTLSLLPLCSLGFFFIYDWLNINLSLRKKINSKLLLLVLLLTFLAYPFCVSLNFAENPVKANIASGDLDQYVKTWPAGGGISESVDFFKNKSRNGKIFVATQGTFGLMPYAYNIYFRDNANVIIKGYYPVGNIVPQEVLDASKSLPTYFVFYQPCGECKNPGYAPSAWQYPEVLSFKKSDNTYLKVYQIK